MGRFVYSVQDSYAGGVSGLWIIKKINNDNKYFNINVLKMQGWQGFQAIPRET